MNVQHQILARALALLMTTGLATCQEQTIVVQSQSSPTATWNVVNSALQSVAATGGRVLFVDPLYEVDAPFALVSPNGRFQVASGTSQLVPVIRYVGSAHERTLFYIQGSVHNVAVEELKLDGNLKVSQLMRVENAGAADQHFLGSVLVRGCVFRNGRQRIWDEGGIVPQGGLDKKWGHEDGTTGFYARGAFTCVTIQDSVFEDFGNIEVPEEPAIKWGVGSRGAWVTTEGDPHCSLPSQTTERPRRVSILDCTFRGITSRRYQHLAAGVLVPIDADGVHIGALTSPNCSESARPHRDGLATVRGCVFETCEYRSVKLQIARAIVHQNSFLRTTHGQCEVDAQYGGGQITDNIFEVQGAVHLQGAGMVQAAYRNDDAEPFVVSGNSFGLPSGVSDLSIVGLGSIDQPLVNVSVLDNLVNGIPRSFIFVWQPPSGKRHSLTVVGNSLYGFGDSFVTVASAASGAQIGGVYVRNASRVPGTQSQQNFAPTMWVSNFGIAHPSVF